MRSDPDTMLDESTIYIFITIVCCFILFLFFAVGLAMFANDFNCELRYLKNKIKSTSGAERRSWKRRKVRLWLSLLPFIKY